MRENYETMTNRELAKAIGQNLTTTRTRLYELGLKRMELEYWTGEQVQFLRDNYREYGDTELAEIFELKWNKDKGWDKKHIEKKRCYLGLKRTKAEKNKINKRNWAQGRFADIHEKMWKERGVTPIGERKVWRMNNRPTVVIKLKDGFVHYAHWLWQQVHGPVPEGSVVRLKDGNPMNVTLDNMQCITRAEHAQRNKLADLPDDIIDVVILNRQLKKLIYERTD